MTSIRPIHTNIGLWISVSLALYVLSLYSYLLFHSLVEMFSIAIGAGIFVVAWNARRTSHTGHDVS